MRKKRFSPPVLFACVFLAAAPVRASHEKEIPKHPLVNDLGCIVFSPILVPTKTVGAWVGMQVEHASFFSKTATFSSGRKISVPEKVAYGVVVMPLAAAASLPVSAGSALFSLGGHVAELFTLPFGKPLRFYRLNDFG